MFPYTVYFSVIFNCSFCIVHCLFFCVLVKKDVNHSCLLSIAYSYERTAFIILFMLAASFYFFSLSALSRFGSRNAWFIMSFIFPCFIFQPERKFILFLMIFPIPLSNLYWKLFYFDWIFISSKELYRFLKNLKSQRKLRTGEISEVFSIFFHSFFHFSSSGEECLFSILLYKYLTAIKLYLLSPGVLHCLFLFSVIFCIVLSLFSKIKSNCMESLSSYFYCITFFMLPFL